jgi:hypothetical protein
MDLDNTRLNLSVYTVFVGAEEEDKPTMSN